MLAISKPYSIKHLSNGASRIYVSAPDLIQASNFTKGQSLIADYSNGLITVKSCPEGFKGSFKLLNTSRGLILELRSKSVRTALRSFGRALVTAKEGLIKIIPHPSELKRLKREQRFKERVIGNKMLDRGSLYSGLGLLSSYLANGLNKHGVKSRIRFVNDICSTALAINTQSNSMWDQRHQIAEAICCDIRELLTVAKIPEVDILDISYPCNGMSTLIEPSKRDTLHDKVGDLFIDTVAAIRASNPTLIVMECTSSFVRSDTLRLIKQALNDYQWHDIKLSGADHGEIENRPRVAVTAISKGLSYALPFEKGEGVTARNRMKSQLIDFLDDIPDTSDLWKSFNHVKRKISDDRLDFKHNVHKPSDTRIATIIATYSSPKIGSPFLAHPTNIELMRQFTVSEHANIKRVEPAIKEHLLKIERGSSLLTNSRGSKSKAQSLLGMSVNRYPWEDLGETLSLKLINNINSYSLF